MDLALNFIDEWGATVGVTALILFMTFIVWDLAKQSNAGKFGTAILFLVLGLGVLGFIIKVVIQLLMESKMN